MPKNIIFDSVYSRGQWKVLRNGSLVAFYSTQENSEIAISGFAAELTKAGKTSSALFHEQDGTSRETKYGPEIL